MVENDRIKLRVRTTGSTPVIFKKPREREGFLQQTWKSFLTDSLKLRQNEINGIVVCSREFTPSNPRPGLGWWAPLNRTIGASTARFQNSSQIHSIKLVSREVLNLAQVATVNPGIQKNKIQTRQRTDDNLPKSTGTSTSKTLPRPHYHMFNDNAVLDTRNIQQNHRRERNMNNDLNDEIEIEILEDDNMSQCTQDEDLLSDLERQGIVNRQIKPDVEKVVLGYKNDTMLQIKKEMLEIKESDIERWRRINTNYLPKTFSFLKEAFGVMYVSQIDG